MKKIISLCFATVMLAGCLGGPKQTTGTLLGAAGGGLLGAQFGKGDAQLAAVAAGTLLGALVGSEIGRALDDNDRRRMGNATYTALETSPSYQPVHWSNPDSGNYGTVTPQPVYVEPQSSRYCREYTQTVYIGGKAQEAYGTACRQPDGTWQVQ